MWQKCPSLLVLRRRDGGLTISHPVTRQECVLGSEQARIWAEWNVSGATETLASLPLDDLHTKRLIAHGVRALNDDGVQGPTDTILHINPSGIRWYRESPDLVILFRTMAAEHSPLLCLGPYASACWQGVVEGRPVQAIRDKVRCLFGLDRVVPVLARLMHLGFIEHAPGFSASPSASSPDDLELANDMVQGSIRHSVVPWYSLWETNTTCDLRCALCYQWRFDDQGIEEEMARSVADQIIASGTLYVSIFGGEALLRSDLERIIARLRAGHVYVKLITHGLLLSPERASSLRAADINHVEISFDGLTADLHDRSRGCGSFARAKEAISIARQAGIPRLGIVLTVHSGTMQDIASLPVFLRSLGVRECYVSPFKKTGLQGSRAPWHTLAQEDTARLMAHIAEWRVSDPDLTVALLPGCTCGRTSVVIGHDATIRSCPFSTVAYGSVRAGAVDRLAEIWRSLEQALPDSGPFGYCQARPSNPDGADLVQLERR
jgi:MoaA/NifB/PqqE/SkfB family radical SAM enzyme